MYRKGFTNASPNNVTGVAENPEDFKFIKYMTILEEVIEGNTENLIRERDINGFKVKNGPNGAEGYWVINAKEGKGKVSYNDSEKPDVTFTVSDEDVSDLISGKLNPQKAFFQGNNGLAKKLTKLQRQAGGRNDAIRSKL